MGHLNFATSDSRHKAASSWKQREAEMRTTFGTLGSERTALAHARDEVRAGFVAAMLELNWHNAQSSSRGLWSSDYAISVQKQLAALLASRRHVTLETGSFHSPPWLARTAGIHHVDRRGQTLAEINYVWNAEARGYWESYIDQVDDSLGLENFAVVRIGSASNVELLFPNTTYAGYDTAAQSGYGLAAGQQVCPHPGWRAATANQGLSPAGIHEWLDWYVTSLVNTANWQMKYLRSKQFAGWFEVLMPGQGMRPAQLATAIGQGLPDRWALPAGAVWHEVMARLPADRVRIHISSVGDRSGVPLDNVPHPADVAADLTRPEVELWSSTRWLVCLARMHGFPISMENVGYTPANAVHYTDLGPTGLLRRCFALVDASKPTVFYWAHSHELWDGTLPFDVLAEEVRARL